jgi:4-amino-4-deoxy-L-arabinose transferase-like glycosyltransferase
MEHVLGFLGLLSVATVTLCLALRYPALRWVLLVALVARVGAALFNFYIAPLPDSTADAERFERIAWLWAQDGFGEALGGYTGPHSYFISWLLSLLYSVAGRSLLLAQSVSVLFGMGGVFLTWRLALELWGERAAIKAAWVAALFPTLILYSALTMREAYVVFFLLLGLLGVARWARGKGTRAVLTALFGFVMAGFFHGAMFVAVGAFLLVLAMHHARRKYQSLRQWRLSLVSMAVLLALLGTGTWYITSGHSVPKLGSFSQLTDVDRLANRLPRYSKDTASYPDWVVPGSPAEVFWKAPARVAYFLFSPFPWDVRYPRHLIGFADGLLYMVLAVLLWRNRKAVWADPAARAVFLVLVPLILVFGVAVGNFGTGLRHRSKMVAGLIVLAAPMLPYVLLRRRTVSEPHAKG